MGASSKLTRALCLAAAAGVPLLLAGCGEKPTPSPSPAPPPPGPPSPAPPPPEGPTDCPANLKRGHCTKCYFTGGAEGVYECKECSAPYSLEDKVCTVKCSSLPKPGPKPDMPATAISHNGVTWPDACFDEEEVHFFAVGDWGGVCDWENGNKCTASSNPKAGEFPELKGKPFPMDNRHGAPLQEPIDFMAQALVADRMKEKAHELKSQGKAPKFVVNVGDNFYPGGVDAHCDNGAPHDAAFGSSQFAQVFEAMYPVEDLGNIEWWSVLGNHDYGGVCYVKGWDQQIYYTYKPNGRWVMPAQYWRRKVQFKTFSADFFFLDTNILDSENPTVDPSHNLCSKESNPGKYCEQEKYPPANGTDPSSCRATGPHSDEDCVKWFQKIWAEQKEWFVDAVKSSEADWQIVITHHPASFSPGHGQSVMFWPAIARQAGIDLIISGHEHEQKVYYKRPGSGTNLGDTAWVVTGGGGGVTSEIFPTTSGHDDAYGFMDMSISLDHINITAISHGGVHGKYIERSRTTVSPRLKRRTADVEAEIEINI